MSPKNPILLHISLVCFDTPKETLVRTISSTVSAVSHLNRTDTNCTVALTIIDNAVPNSITLNDFSTLRSKFNETNLEFRLIQGRGNLGYGPGQNLAFFEKRARYHLFLNPDVDLTQDCLAIGLSYLEDNADVAIVSPRAIDAQGKRHFLCKRYPTILDLFIRGFVPPPVKLVFSDRISKYEMHDLSELTPTKGIPIVSGCFMLCRSEIIDNIAGFDPAFFLYFEDFDLSMRAGKIASIAYVPAMSIAHYGGNTMRKGLKHVLFFCRSGVRFFRKHGWRWF